MAEYTPRTALIVVDMQNDFADPKGGLYVSGGEDVVAFINAQIAEAQAAGALVVYSQDWHPQTTPHFQKDGGIWPVHCVAESWGAQFHPALRVDPAAEVIHKGTSGEDGYSAFSMRDPQSGARSATRLEKLLERNAIERVVIAGLATDYCVRETAVDAVKLGFATDVLREGVRAVDLQPGDGDRALREMAAAGAHVL